MKIELIKDPPNDFFNICIFIHENLDNKYILKCLTHYINVNKLYDIEISSINEVLKYWVGFSYYIKITTLNGNEILTIEYKIINDFIFYFIRKEKLNKLLL